MTRPASAREHRRRRRAEVAGELAGQHGGVAHRRDLRAHGVSRFDVRTEISAGRWSTAGRHTVVIGGAEPSGEGRWWWALWESGHGAVLHGTTALLAAGLSGYADDRLHVSLPRSSTVHRLPGVRPHQHRRLDPVVGAGLPRVNPVWATIRAAQWAVSDRQAALLVCLPVQQRLVHPGRLLDAWSTVRRSPRRAFLDAVVGDVCDGAHSLGELDVAALCRRHGVPRPRRQVVRSGSRGRVYLDVEFDGGVVVEIDGAHHLAGLNPVDDALRANELTLASARVLRIPVLGLRLAPDAFMAQVRRLVLAHGPAVRAP